MASSNHFSSASRRQFLHTAALASPAFLLGDYATAQTAMPGDRPYTVKSGDTLGSIARTHETSVAAIKARNQLSTDLIRVGQALVLPPAGVTRPVIIHTVRSGDTIGELATLHGTTAQEIRALNSLSSDLIRVGQPLRIPGSANPYSLIPQVVGVTGRMNISSHRWKYIVVHHSATSNGNATIFGNYHKRRGMTNGLAYHFVIGNGSKSKDGEVEIGSRWHRQIQGGHVSTASVNQVGIGICLVGNFERTKPSSSQIASLYQLLQYLKAGSAPRAKVAVHKEINPGRTLCPGRYFPTRTLHEKFG